MTVTGVRFVGIRTEAYEATVRLFRDALDLVPDLGDEEKQTGFRLSDGTRIEIYGPENELHSFFTTGPVVGFHVTDFDDAHARLAEAGAEFIGPVQREAGVSWHHFRGPDGTIYEIIGPGEAG